MPSLRLNVLADVANMLIPDFPFIRRLEFSESIAIEYDQVTGASYVAVPGSSILTAIQVVILTADKNITVRTSGQTDAGSLIGADGLFLLFNCNLSAITVQNNSGDTAHITGLLMGA